MIDLRNPQTSGHTVIAFGHKKSSGKDQAASYLAKEYGYEKRAFANPIKKAIGQGVFGLSDEQCFGGAKGEEDDYWGVSPGELFQIVGTELFRKGLQEHFPEHFNGQIWARAECRELIDRQKDGQYGKYVFTDLRFPDEGAFLKRHFGAACVRIDTPRRLRKRRGGGDLRDPDHPSETALDDWGNWDYIIDNSVSRQALRRAALTVMALEEGREISSVPQNLYMANGTSLRR